MAYIKVDFDKLDLLKERISKIYNSSGLAMNTVENVRNNLDWRVSIQEDINDKL